MVLFLRKRCLHSDMVLSGSGQPRSILFTVDLLFILLLNSAGIVRFHLQAVNTFCLLCLSFIFVCLCALQPTKKEVFQSQIVKYFL